MTADETHETIVRLLAQTSIAVSPAALAANARELTDTDLTTGDVEDALTDLTADELVEPLADTDYYRLTDHGRDYADSQFAENATGYID